ncbi:MAG: DUF899 family protein [Bacteroidota bacterium]
MSTFRFPNEPDDYREQRDALLEAEVALRAQIEAVAAQRRQLPLGGRLKEAYTFERIDDDGRGESVPFDALFGDHDSLILYSLMFGKTWDAPCPSCTSIVDGINANARAVASEAAVAVVADATAEQLAAWTRTRGWHMTVVSAATSSYIVDYAGYDTDDAGAVSAMNVFRKTADGTFHFWASELNTRPMENAHPRHVDMVWPLWNLLDLTPGGRGTYLVPRQNYEHRYFSKRMLGE